MIYQSTDFRGSAQLSVPVGCRVGTLYTTELDATKAQRNGARVSGHGGQLAIQYTEFCLGTTVQKTLNLSTPRFGFQEESY